MTRPAENHLTEEALDDILIGLGSPASHAHLEQCPECCARVDAFRFSIDSLNQASLAWVKAQPVRTASAPAPRRPIFARPIFAVWAVAALLLAAAGPSAWHLIAPRTVQAPATIGVEDSDAQIAEDNELLRAVDAALTPDEKSVVDEYQLNDSSASEAQPQTRKE